MVHDFNISGPRTTLRMNTITPLTKMVYTGVAIMSCKINNSSTSATTFDEEVLLKAEKVYSFYSPFRCLRRSRQYVSEGDGRNPRVWNLLIKGEALAASSLRRNGCSRDMIHDARRFLDILIHVRTGEGRIGKIECKRVCEGVEERRKGGKEEMGEL